MSDASRHKLYVVKETVYGTTPATPSMSAVRHTGTTLGMAKGSQLSEELRADRQISDFRHGTRQIGGDLSVELSFGSFDMLLAAALCGIWAAKATVEATNLSITDVNEITSAAANFETLGFEVGDEIVITGFTDGANNGTFIIETVAAGVMTVTVDTLVVEAAGDTVEITTSKEVLTAGVERSSFSFLRHFTDQETGDKPFHLFSGVVVNTFSLTVSPEPLITGTFGVLGKDGALATTAPAGSTLGTPSTSRVFNAFNGSVKENDVELGIATEISFTLENGMEPRWVIGSSRTLEPSIGRSNLTGSLVVYFDDSSMVEKFYNETSTSLEFTLVDPDNNSYTFLIPNISLTGGQPDVSGQSTVTLSVPFQALLDSAVGSNIKITKTPALS